MAVGLVKANTDAKNDDFKNLVDRWILNPSDQEVVSSLKSFLNTAMLSFDAVDNQVDTFDKKSKTLGNVRTGLLATSTVVSSVSTGTSIGATLTAGQLAEKMAKCNSDLRELKLALGQLEMLDEKHETASNILSVCSGFDEDNINQLKTLSTANAVISGVGVGVAGAGTITSAIANTKKVRNDDSEDGKRKEKNLNLASNILAGVSTGTSIASTALSATAIAKAKKDSEMAEKCEKLL